MDGKEMTEYDKINFEMQPDVPWELELKKNSFNQLSERLEVVVENVNKFSNRVTKKPEHSTFLVNVTNEFELDIIRDLGNLRVVTDEDQLEALM